MAAAPVRRVWLCADDYGISPGVNAAIRDLMARGRLNATSVMTVAPSFDRSEAIALKVLNNGVQRVAIGLHFTLTAPFRPLTSGYGPAREGAFLPLGTTLGMAFLRRLDPAKIAAEAIAQLDAFVGAFGKLPDFIDGHQHVQLFPQVGAALLDVVKDRAPAVWLRQCGRHGPLPQRLSDRKGLLLDCLSANFRRQTRRRGLRCNPAFAGTYDFSAGSDLNRLFAGFFDGLPQNSVVMCHPGFVDAELKRLDPVTAQREREYAFFAGNDFPRLLAEKGIALG
jgi:predicted glycoside hydrolase/deacetylase ChbG (UPF0249 family)